jgi:putative membrane protein
MSSALDPWIAAPLAGSAVLYAVGVARLWKRAGVGRGIERREAALFAIAWIVLAAALVSPIDHWGEHLLSMHMVQHELLMVVAAPLFVLARPLEAFTWGLAPGWRARLAAAARWRALAAPWQALTTPLGAWLVQALAVWLWHVPLFFQASLASEAIHSLQHATFLAAALAFWWTVLAPRSRPGGAALASTFGTLLHTGALGALLTFAPHALYPAYTGYWGLTPIEDQQLAGLVMWVPGGVAYLVAGLVLASGWVQEPPRAPPVHSR